MEEPKEDSRAITEMELEYVRVMSTHDDWHRGDYGNIPTYHAVPSHPGVGKDDYRMLEGCMAEVLPATEVALLRVEDTGVDQPTGQPVTLEEHPTTKG